jgi:rhodanese-related sulfurtransferase
MKSLRDYTDEARLTVREVSPAEAQELAASGEWTMLDVREPDEYREGHVPGAINVSRGFLEVKADPDHQKREDRMQDRGQKIVVICGGGVRSLLAAKTLQDMGFREAVSVRGGIKGWREAGLPESTDE